MDVGESQVQILEGEELEFCTYSRTPLLGISRDQSDLYL